MAVHSKADKTGGHRSTGAKTKSYSQAAAPAPGSKQLGPAGTKALLVRARRELAPLEDPNQPIAD